MPKSLSEDIANGHRQFLWAKDRMPALALSSKYVVDRGGADLFFGLRIAICLHVSKETSVLISYLRSLGANVELVAANPLSTKDPIANYLRSKGVVVRGRGFESSKQYASNIRRVSESEPEIIVDDGGELHVAYSKTDQDSCYGGTDETTSGTVRLKSLEKAGLLRYPVIPVNEGRTKHLFDNRYGTGQSSLDGLLRATGLLIAGKVVVVAGYGWVGKGVAQKARGMGARVIITEVEPLSALEAFFDGFEVKRMKEASKEGQIFLTCTGQINVIGIENFNSMPDGVILGNCGHFDKEIDISALKRTSKTIRKLSPFVTEYRMSGKSILLLCEGRVVNLVAAEGHPPEVMQLSFAGQLLSIFFLLRNRKKLSALRGKVLQFPKEIDQMVAQFALSSFHLRIDKLSDLQKEYSGSFS